MKKLNSIKIKYQKKILSISPDDYQGIIYARSVGLEQVDIQQPDGDKFKIIWLKTIDIED